MSAWKHAEPLPSVSDRVEQEREALEAVEAHLDAITARYPLGQYWQFDPDMEFDEGRRRDLSRYRITLTADALRACGVRLPQGWPSAEIALSRGGDFVEEVTRG